MIVLLNSILHSSSNITILSDTNNFQKNVTSYLKVNSIQLIVYTGLFRKIMISIEHKITGKNDIEIFVNINWKYHFISCSLQKQMGLQRWPSVYKSLQLIQRIWVQFSAHTFWLTIIHNSSFWKSDALLWTSWVPHSHLGWASKFMSFFLKDTFFSAFSILKKLSIVLCVKIVDS